MRWFYQAFAPLTTLANVRSAGQIAHNDIEVELLQKKWGAAGIPIHTVTFEFDDARAPLSWHLTPSEQSTIRATWKTRMEAGKKRVRDFLAGSDTLQYGCPSCAHTAAPKAEAAGQGS